MRKITNNNITNEVSKAINTTIKYLNTYNTTWNVEIMEFPNKYNIILKTDNVCFDLENIYETLFNDKSCKYDDILYFKDLTFITTTKYEESHIEESELNITKVMDSNDEYIMSNVRLLATYQRQMPRSVLTLANQKYQDYDLVIQTIKECFVENQTLKKFSILDTKYIEKIVFLNN